MAKLSEKHRLFLKETFGDRVSFNRNTTLVLSMNTRLPVYLSPDCVIIVSSAKAWKNEQISKITVIESFFMAVPSKI